MRPLLILGLAASLLCCPGNSRARADIDADTVKQSIERGIQYLRREQRADGSWPDHPGLPGGITSLCTLSLLNAGVPLEDPQIQAALNYVRKLKLAMTYTVSLQTMVLCAAEPQKDLLRIRENVRWLEEVQLRNGDKKGSWGYSSKQGVGDNSNSQFALLALHEAERAGVPVSEQTWRLASNYWERTQNLDGSWGYMEGQSGTGSMTCAGISAMIITADKLNPGDAEVDGNTIRCCGQQEPNSPVDNGLAWLGRNFSVHTNPGNRSGQSWLLYYLYGVERVGRLTNQRFIGKHDWYREGADLLVKSQEELSGFWKGSGHGEDNPHVGTALSLLFLAKGRRPVLVSKLKHEPLHDWNHHRTDLANLTSYVEKQWRRELTWQVIDPAHATPDDLIQSPVLFLSGQLEPEFNDEQVKNLREYIDRGGFIFAEACCGGQDFDRGFRRLVKRLFPEPEHDLHLLPPEHPVWTAEEQVDAKYIRPLWGVDIGCRTSLVYCPENLGCYWELARLGRESRYPPQVQTQLDAARSIGINVLAYATNREVKFKLDTPPVLAGDNQFDNFERAKIYIAKLQHTGGWNIAPGALPNLMKAVQREAGLRVSVDQRPVALSDPQLFDYYMVFMHGRNAFQLSPVERKQLRTYVERGGVVMADAVCGSEEFARSFRREMTLAFPDQPLKPIPAAHAMFTSQFGGFDLKKVKRHEPQPHAAGEPLKVLTREAEPELEGVKIGDSYGVIFSPYDLSCALERHDSMECPGYTRDDAARIGLNLVLYSLHD
jgi:hypothetical protein